MTDQNSAAVNQNPATEMHYRPDEVQELLNIKSAAYYDRVKFLGIKAQKNEEGKAYLTQKQFDQLKRLGLHIQKTGKMDGFVDSEECELTISNSVSLAAVDESNLIESIPALEEPTIENDLGKQIFRAAAELKASELAMMPQVIREVANRLTKDDLPDDLKQKVERTEEATRPNFQPSAIADKLLNQIRQSRQAA